MSDQQFLEMADHCKQLIEKKETIIAFYKDRIDDIEIELRKMEYKVKAMEHLLRYKENEAIRQDKKIYSYLLQDTDFLYKIIDKSRCLCNVDEEDEEIILMLQTNLD